MAEEDSKKRMTQNNIADTLRELITPLATGLGLRLWGLELVFGGRGLVRIYVEKDESAEPEDRAAPAQTEDLDARHGVSIEQCAELSRLVSLSLDVEDIIPGSYVLEVSSPGLERTFFTPAQLAGAVGKVVEINLHTPLAAVPDRRRFRGRLTDVPSPGRGDLFSLMAEDTPKPGETATISFAFSDVKKARQTYAAPEKTPPGKGGAAKRKKNGEKKSAGLKENAGSDADAQAVVPEDR